MFKYIITIILNASFCFCQLYAQEPLNCNPAAVPDVICSGEVSQLTANASGGSGIYSYYWTSDPPGFTSEDANPIVSPVETTSYNVDVTDGFDYITANVNVIVYNQLTLLASPDFQLCQNGQQNIKVQNTNAGKEFTTIWYFQGNAVGYDSIYSVTWSEYGQYAPNTITFTCVITDGCGNSESDLVNGTFFPTVEITGVQLICLGETIQLLCSGAQSYEWHYGNLSGPLLGIAQVLNYTPVTPGFHTICVLIINDCGELADACFTFEVSELICEIVLNNSPTDFSVCPGVPFTLEEINAYDGWEWSWNDNGPQMAWGKTISLSFIETGQHSVKVIAYNLKGCYDTLTRIVTVFPFSGVQAFADLASVCIDYPVNLSAMSGPVSIANYYWTAIPPDESLSGQQNSATPTVTPQVTTTYQCKIMDNNGCYDSTTVMVNVRPQIEIEIFGDPDSSCTGIPVQLDFQTVVAPLPGAVYAWNFYDGVPSTSYAIQPPPITWSTPGLKNIQLHILESGCESTFSFQYLVLDIADCTGINDPVTESGFHIYPNPGNGMIHVENTGGNNDGLLTITDTFGRDIVKNLKIIYSNMDATYDLNLKSYPPGIYLIRISEKGNYLLSMKYLLNK